MTRTHTGLWRPGGASKGRQARFGVPAAGGGSLDPGVLLLSGTWAAFPQVHPSRVAYLRPQHSSWLVGGCGGGLRAQVVCSFCHWRWRRGELKLCPGRKLSDLASFRASFGDSLQLSFNTVQQFCVLCCHKNSFCICYPLSNKNLKMHVE